MNITEEPALYPLFLRLEGEPVVVIGAGNIAYRKIMSLLASGAKVTVIAPDVAPEIQQLSDEGKILLMKRPYRSGDASSALLVISATGQPAVDEEIFLEAQKHNALVNVVDVPHLCNAYVPSVLRRKKLQIAVSTSGAAPSLARDIRKDLEKDFDDSWAEYIDLLAEIRALVKERIDGPASNRSHIFEHFCAMGLQDKIRAGETLDVEAIYTQGLKEYQTIVGEA
ncbi:MAG: bifunctional precorrin-2 dehydrogenase/sirohydrochlorin ferrochelatase [Eggerthellaceae bacterium]|nr:bifunctional precorrin-2 dehydrogenase/sirohydrochlorin ferrochelatase [Eggerthellaceae bacterium]